ncbi:MAG: flagellar biosynthesis protein FlhB [Epsilonproteobacteria bacterium]|nr:flagellar biosynthesis protein FlhB [Campylobacterota bacterium]NPA56886.1 flagellar biosynthesis protein FlhB [Campylobacterota bacterium]
MAKDPSKTEKATPHRRQKAREEGQVAKSADIPISASLIVTFLALIPYIPYAFERLRALFIYFLSDPLHSIPEESRGALFPFLISNLALLLLPLFLIFLIVGIASNIAQFGFLFTLKSLTPKLDKINPIAGLQRIFSLKTLFELFKNLLKLGVALAVSYGLITYLLDDVFRFASTSIYDDAYYLVRYTLIMILGFALLSIPVSAVDLFFKRYEFEESIKMSKEEIKEEQKLFEGNPQIKGAIRKKMREMSMLRMMAEVAQADVVITNPEHYAVALKYDRKGGMEAPTVVAKGVDHLALRIREKALEHGVPIEENPPLARALYRSCEVGETIPYDLYEAIAKIFAKIYRKRGEKL